MAHYSITAEGLVFEACREEREEIAEALKHKGYGAAFYVAFTLPLCNGLSYVRPEDIDALTSAPIFTDASLQDDNTYPAHARFFWFPNYQVECPLQTLADTGKVVFYEAT